MDKLDAYDLATPEEREKYHLRDHLARTNPERSQPFMRLSADKRSAVLKRLSEILNGSTDSTAAQKRATSLAVV